MAFLILLALAVAVRGDLYSPYGAGLGYGPGLAGSYGHGIGAVHYASPPAVTRLAPVHGAYGHVGYAGARHGGYGAASTQSHSQDSLGQYSYGYADINSAKKEVRTADGVVRGSYSYVDPYGIPQKVSYVSDALGFRVAATNLPVGPDAHHRRRRSYGHGLAYGVAGHGLGYGGYGSGYAGHGLGYAGYGSGYAGHGLGYGGYGSGYAGHGLGYAGYGSGYAGHGLGYAGHGLAHGNGYGHGYSHHKPSGFSYTVKSVGPVAPAYAGHGYSPVHGYAAHGYTHAMVTPAHTYKVAGPLTAYTTHAVAAHSLPAHGAYNSHSHSAPAHGAYNSHAYSAQAHGYAAHAAASTQSHSQDSLGQYSYGYADINSAKQETKTADGVVRGAYSYVDPYGIPQKVSYVSDAYGFRVAATNLPVGPKAAH